VPVKARRDTLDAHALLPLRTVEEESGVVYSVAFSPNGKLLAYRKRQ